MKNPLPPTQKSGAGARVSDGARTRDTALSAVLPVR